MFLSLSKNRVLNLEPFFTFKELIFINDNQGISNNNVKYFTLIILQQYDLNLTKKNDTIFILSQQAYHESIRNWY